MASCTHVGDHLALATGGTVYPNASTGAWALDATGDNIGGTAYALLVGASPGGANPDGLFTSNGVSYWLKEVPGGTGTWANAVAK